MPVIKCLTAPLFRIILSAILLFALPPGPSWADGNSGIVRFTDLNFSQNEFRSLSERELRAILGTDEYYQHFYIDGFSGGWGPEILRMMLAQRGRMRRLMRDMSRLTSHSDRRARLREEIQWVDDLKDNIGDSIARLNQRPDNAINRAIIAGEETRFQKLEKYKMGLRRWVASPEQGLR